MHIKELIDYNDYCNHQNGRSGMANNENRIIDDLYMLEGTDINFESYKNSEFYILDIGCRAGATVIKDLRKLGYAFTYGCDIGEQAHEAWKSNSQWWQEEKLTDFIKKADIHDGNPFDFKFHMVSISHTLEHCYDPEKAVKVIHDLLLDGGIVYVIIPFQTKDELYNHNPHYVSFENEEEHIKFWENNGFEVINHKVVNMHNTQIIPGESRLWLQKI